MRISLIQMNSRASGREENVGSALGFVASAARDKTELAGTRWSSYFPQYRLSAGRLHYAAGNS